VAALIEKERLLDRAQLSLPLLTDPEGKLLFDPLQPPKTVPSQCSYLKKGRSYIITASGGVEIDAWGVVEKNQTDAAVDKVHRASTGPQNGNWWWN
jgi:hypothetical protein